jgi:hypothetical protein
LGQGRDEEKEVEEELELVVQDLRNKGDEVVLRVFNQVILVVDGLYVPIKIDLSLTRLNILEKILLKLLQQRGRVFRLLLAFAGSINDQPFFEGRLVVTLHFSLFKVLIFHIIARRL